MPGLRGQLLEILQLYPAVTVSEGMDLVHITDDLPRPGGEVFRRKALKEG